MSLIFFIARICAKLDIVVYRSLFYFGVMYRQGLKCSFPTIFWFSSGDFCSSKVNGNYRDSANCHGYIACSNGITYHMPCPAGLVWNDAKKICDWKRNVPPPCGTLTSQTTSSPVRTSTQSMRVFVFSLSFES